MNYSLSFLYDLSGQVVSDFLSFVSPSASVSSHVSRRLSQTPGYVTFLILVAISGLMLYMLRTLKKFSDDWKGKMKKRIQEALDERKAIKDPFRATNGYSWDLVLVFPIYGPNDKTTKKQNSQSLKYVLNRLADGGLETKQFYSIQKDELYVKIRAPLRRLMREADRVDFKLRMNDMQLENTLREGRLDKGWGSIQFPPLMEVIETEMEPCQYIYAAYEYNSETGTTRDDLASIFQKYGEGDSIFRGVDRIKLILTIISARSFEGGCQLDVHKLIQQNCMLGYSPIHDYVELRGLEDEWLRFLQAPWKQKCDAVKDYFGEKIGMYFLFLGHYTTWLIPAGVMGFIAYIDVSADNDNPSAPIIPYFAVFMSIWSTLMLEFWCRKEKLHAMKWGMVGFEDEEQARPQFHGTLIPGPVTGELFLYFPTNEYMKRVFTSTAIVSGCILVVLGVIISIFILKIVLTSMKSLTVGGTQMGGIIVSLVNAVQIQVLNMLYGTVAIALNNFENHRTNTEYEDALIAKTFIFQFVNSFSPMFYIAFVKPFIPEYDACLVSCMSELQTSLGTIFMTRLATGSVVEILVPYLNNKNREKANLEGTDFKVSDMSNVERGYMQEEYHVMLGPFADFANMTIQFGYTTMFVVAFPLATIIAFISNYIEIRIGAWKLCQLCRRPEPRSCEDIGTWYSIFQTISFSAALVNAGIIAFTSEIANKYTWVVRVWLFFSISLLLLGAKTVVQMLTPDMPLDVDIQLQRQKYIVDKVINNIPDDNDDALGKNVSIEQDYPIRITDDDPL